MSDWCVTCRGFTKDCGHFAIPPFGTYLNIPVQVFAGFGADQGIIAGAGSSELPGYSEPQCGLTQPSDHTFASITSGHFSTRSTPYVMSNWNDSTYSPGDRGHPRLGGFYDPVSGPPTASGVNMEPTPPQTPHRSGLATVLQNPLDGEFIDNTSLAIDPKLLEISQPYHHRRVVSAPEIPASFPLNSGDNTPAMLEIGRLEQNWPCPSCSSAFTSEEALRRHLKRDHGEKLHRCSLCPYYSKWKKDIDRHMPKHTGLSEYGCVYCGKFFTRRDNLRRHQRTLHEQFETSTTP